MENYTLKQNETVLFRSEITLLPNGKREANQKTPRADLILTNLYIVLIKRTKRLFSEIISTEIYDVNDVKIYDESVQILRNKALVDIYTKKGEIFIEFDKEKLAKSFCDKAIRLISGFSKLVRAVKKTQKAINETNEALDIDIIDGAKKVGSAAVTVAEAMSGIPGAGKKTKAISFITSALFGKRKSAELEAKKDNSNENNVQKQ